MPTETLGSPRSPRDRPVAGAFDAFAAHLDEWRPIADRDEPFRWVSDEPAERVKYLLNALYWAGTIVERESADGTFASTRGRRVPRHVGPRCPHALEQESEADAHFVEELRGVWGMARLD